MTGGVQRLQERAGCRDGAVSGDGDDGAALAARSGGADGGKGDADGIPCAVRAGQIRRRVEIELGKARLIIARVRIGQRLSVLRSRIKRAEHGRAAGGAQVVAPAARLSRRAGHRKQHVVQRFAGLAPTGKCLAEISLGKADAAAEAGCVLHAEARHGSRGRRDRDKRTGGGICFPPDRHADAQRQLHGRAGHAARFGQQLKARRGRACVQRRRDGLVRVLAPERGNSLAVRLPRDDGPAAKIFAPFAVRLAPAVDRGGNRRGAARRYNGGDSADGDPVCIRAAIRQRSRSQRSQHRAYHQQRGDPFPNPFHIVTPLSAAECRSVCFLLPVYRIFLELQHFCK